MSVTQIDTFRRPRTLEERLESLAFDVEYAAAGFLTEILNAASVDEALAISERIKAAALVLEATESSARDRAERISRGTKE